MAEKKKKKTTPRLRAPAGKGSPSGKDRSTGKRRSAGEQRSTGKPQWGDGHRSTGEQETREDGPSSPRRSAEPRAPRRRRKKRGPDFSTAVLTLCGGGLGLFVIVYALGILGPPPQLGAPGPVARRPLTGEDRAAAEAAEAQAARDAIARSGAPTASQLRSIESGEPVEGGLPEPASPVPGDGASPAPGEGVSREPAPEPAPEQSAPERPVAEAPAPRGPRLGARTGARLGARAPTAQLQPRAPRFTARGLAPPPEPEPEPAPAGDGLLEQAQRAYQQALRHYRTADQAGRNQQTVIHEALEQFHAAQQLLYAAQDANPDDPEIDALGIRINQLIEDCVRRTELRR